MQQYLELLRSVLAQGEERDTRSMPTKSIFGGTMRFDLTEGFPLLTTKQLHWKSIVHELLWIMSGSTNAKPLQELGVKIWDKWADGNGDLGPIYGKQWRAWQSPKGTIDQLALLIEGIQNEPLSRRHILSAWNPADVPDMRLPPCHILLQCWVGANGTELRSQLYQRSADLFLGVPFNIASYSLLTHMIAQVCSLRAREFIWTGGDIHLYQNQYAVASEQLARTPGKLPELTIDPSITNIDDFRYEHFTLHNYTPQPHIAAEVVA